MLKFVDYIIIGILIYIEIPTSKILLVLWSHIFGYSGIKIVGVSERFFTMILLCLSTVKS